MKRCTKLELSEVNDIDSFMYSASERWRLTSTGLRCTQGILEEVLSYWKRWNSQLPVLEQWLDAADAHLPLSEEEKMEFFQDIGAWKEKFETLSEVAAFLVTTCDPSVAHQVFTIDSHSETNFNDFQCLSYRMLPWKLSPIVFCH